MASIAICAWLIGILVAASSIVPADLIGVPLVGIHQGRISIVFDFWARIVIFPTTVLALALIETSRGHFGKRLALLGDISYSSYLIHFPLQLLAVIVAGWLSLERSIFYSPWVMLGFFAVLVTSSVLSHRYFEMPAQAFLRSRMLIARTTAAG